MPPPQRKQTPPPPPHPPLLPIAPPVINQDRPDGVNLTVLPQQVLAAEDARRQVPYSHFTTLPFFCRGFSEVTNPGSSMYFSVRSSLRRDSSASALVLYGPRGPASLYPSTNHLPFFICLECIDFLFSCRVAVLWPGGRGGRLGGGFAVGAALRANTQRPGGMVAAFVALAGVKWRMGRIAAGFASGSGFHGSSNLPHCGIVARGPGLSYQNLMFGFNLHSWFVVLGSARGGHCAEGFGLLCPCSCLCLMHPHGASQGFIGSGFE